jgi:predicted site-specific integrase-resolvase
MTSKTWLTREEAAARLKVSTRTLARYTELGLIRRVKGPTPTEPSLGLNVVRYQRSEIERYRAVLRAKISY